MVDAGPAVYRQTYSPSRLAWSECRRSLGAASCICQMNRVYGVLESVVSVCVTAP